VHDTVFIHPTQAGSDVYTHLQAVVLICRKQGLNVFASLRRLFASSWHQAAGSYLKI